MRGGGRRGPPPLHRGGLQRMQKGRVEMGSIVKGLLAGLLVLAATSGSASAQSGAIVDGPEVVWNHSLWGKPRSFTAEVEGLAKFLEDRKSTRLNYSHVTR